MDTDTEFLDEPNEHLIALNCGSPANIAHYIATLHREIVKLWMRVDPERQRDAAQGNGEEGRTGAVSPAPLTTAAAADRSAPSPAPIDASTHWFGCGIDGGRRHYECLVGEYEDLRARLAEREAELAALRSCERERLIAEVAENASAMLSGFFPYPLVAAANRLANHESARRAKETT